MCCCTRRDKDETSCPPLTSPILLNPPKKEVFIEKTDKELMDLVDKIFKKYDKNHDDALTDDEIMPYFL